MNKIYKVVWSKVKHCYVVTSELAKRNGKGCGTRSLRTATVSLGVAAALLCTGAVLPIFGESVAEAKTTKVQLGNKIVNTTVDYTTVFNFQYPEKSITVGATEINAVTNAYGVFGNVAQRMGKKTTDTVSFNVVDGQLIEVHNVTMSYVVDDKNPYQRVLAVHPFNYSKGTDAEIDDEIKNSDGAKADVSGYTVTMTGGSLQEVTGGLSNGGKVSNNTVNLNGGTAYKVYGGYTVGGAAETNHVVLNGGIAGVSGTIVSGGELYGAYSYNDSGNSGDVTGNTVTVKSGIVMAPVYGGSTQAEGTGNQSGDATENIVTIEDGTLSGDIYGGYSDAQYKTSGNVEGNQVIIKGGVLKSAPVTINGTNYNTVGVWNIYGGYTYGYDNDTDTNASGIAKDNEVTISGGTLRDDVRVIGGHSNGNHAEHNTVTITKAYTGTVGTVIGGEAQLAATKNEVAINGGTAKGNVLGALSYAGAAGGDSAAAGNKAAVDSAVVEGNLIGGWGYQGAANYNTVTVKGSTSKIGDASNDNVAPVIGGLSGYFGASISSDAPNSGDAKNNTVTIENGNIDGSIYGGASITHTSKTSGDVTGNKVQINGGKVLSSVYGGYNHSGSADKTASNNEVTMGGGSADEVYGGWSLLGKAAQNTVTLNSGAEAGKVYGGWGGATAEKNEVIINGGTVGGVVFGGGGAIWYNSTATGVETATGNTVTVKDGTVKNVTGGSGIDSAENNTVIIEKTGKVSNTIVGGDSATGNIKNNTVTIKGGTIGNLVYAAQYAKGSKGTITDNVINLTGNVTLGTYVHLRGYEDYNRSSDEVPNHSGNDLHVGGIKGGATGVWQGRNSEGTVTNTVVSVTKFDTIVYHSVKWDENVAALAATTVENIGAIDINDLTFDSASATGTMALLKATGDGADLSAIKLNYSGSTGVAITTGGVVLSGGTPTTEITGVNGVKLTTTSSDKVLLASDKKAINYSKGATTVSAITFGEFDIDAANAARDLTGSSFATGNTVDAGGLTFKDTTKALKKNNSITLVSKATGITTTVDNGTGKTIGINYTDDQKIAFTAKATGDVTSAGGAVKYTVGSVAVNNIDVTKWDGTPSTVTASWDTKNAEVKTSGISVTGMNPGDTKTILTAASGSDFSSVTLDAGAWQKGGDITDTDTSGVSVTGTTTGGGVKVDDTNKNVLVYQKDAKTITGITLGSVAFTKDGTVRSFDNSYNLTGADFTTTGFSISNAATATMNAGDTMVVVDAANAIKGTGDATLKDFTATNVGVTFTDAIEGTVLTLAGTRADTLEQNAAKTQIIFKVGDKNVETATFNGSVTWSDTAAHYTNDATKYKFNGATNIDATNLIVTGTTDKALKSGDVMTLLSADNMTASITNDQSAGNKTASKITVNYNDTASVIAMGAEATGEVKAATNAVNYEVTGVALNSVDLTNWNGTTAVVSEATAGWTVKNGASITTGDLADAGLDTMDPGDVKPILTADTTADFSVANISGNKAWQDGGTITDTDTSGVTVAGATTGGGVKVDDTNKNVLVYQKDAKTITGITLGSVAFTKDGKVRSFDNSYNLTGADFTTTGFGISNASTATMNAGDTMVVVDAVNAIKGTGDATLQDFTTTNAGDAIAFTDQIEGKALTLSGTHQDTLEQNEAKNQILYKVGDKNVTAAIFTGEVAWNDSEAYYTNDTSKYKIAATNVDAEDLIVTGTTTKALKTGDTMTLLSADSMTATIATDQSAANKTASKVTVNYKDGQGVAFAAEAKGAVTAEAGAVKYNINEVKLTNVDLSGWTGSESSVPGTWTADDGSVKVATGSFAEPDVAIGSARTILTAGSAFFADANISGANKYDEANGKAFSETQNNVTVSGTQAKGVAASEDSKSLVYKVDIKKADTVSLGATNWQKGATLFDGSSATEYDYANVTAVDAGKFDVTYASPETVAAGESMTLLKANETLTAIINEEKAKAYSFSPVSGVTVDAAITGKLANSGNNVVFTAAANQASKLTFGDVEWKDSGALLTRPRNITFAGADVDTSRINFTNMIYLDADRQMTLVTDFGDKVGTITGSKYLVGTAFEGEGAASLSGSDLVFRTKTGAGVSEQTHKTVMATEVGVTMLNTGNDYIDKAMEGMGDLANVAPDGTTVGAAIGGGRNRYETGSHVNVNSWNAAVAVGAKRELKNGSLEYGVFGEYGKANFTLHSDAGKGDGDSHYAGGGLLAKWTNKHDVYTEASFRLGRLNESSSDIMRDGLGNTYGYDVHANYFGAHVGVGKIFRYKGGKSLDVYGKYFYTKRDGVEFDAVQHYNLDSVNSSVLRIGARYGTTDKKWNWYGGLAYEYEFDGEAKGTVNGTEIRAASIKGSSVRAEFGMRMEATKTNPWQMDISLYGYGGKHRGIGGNVNVAYMF